MSNTSNHEPSGKLLPDDSPPRNRTIFVYSVISVISLIALKYVFDSYMDWSALGQQRANVSQSVATGDLLEYRAAAYAQIGDAQRSCDVLRQLAASSLRVGSREEMTERLAACGSPRPSVGAGQTPIAQAIQQVASNLTSPRRGSLGVLRPTASTDTDARTGWARLSDPIVPRIPVAAHEEGGEPHGSEEHSDSAH